MTATAVSAATTPVKLVSKPRSNRAITEWACQQVRKFYCCDVRDLYYEVSEKNTRVRFVNDGNLQVITVFLFDEEILRLTSSDGKALTLAVSFTSFLDSYGQPTTTTNERLNGLLDCLGWLHILPKGVRLFRGEHNTTYLGKNDEKVAVGRKLFRSVFITPNPDRLKFSGFSADEPGVDA